MVQMTKSKPKHNKKGYRFLLSLNEEQKQAKAEILDNDISVVFENIFDGETGVYDEDWENYERE